MKIIIPVDVKDPNEAGDLRRGLRDPQVFDFVVRMGRMDRQNVSRTVVLQYVEAQMFSWRIPKKRKGIHGSRQTPDAPRT